MPDIINTLQTIAIKVFNFATGQYVTTNFPISEDSEGYKYFNDNNRYRILPTGETQIYYPERKTWITIDAEISNSTSVNINEIQDVINGGTGVAPNFQVELAVQYALDIAQDNRHGYDQAYRWNGYSNNGIKRPNLPDGYGDFDCSSLVYTVFNKAHFNVPINGSYWTGTIKRDFVNAGFTWFGNSRLEPSQLRRGDILLRNGHTAIYIGGGYIVQAGSNEFGGIRGGEPGDSTGNEIGTKAFANAGNWDGILRWVE